MLGGVVGSGVVGGEYGRMPIDIQPGSRLYSYQDNAKPNVWMSHGDEATQLPPGFRTIAKSHQVRGGMCGAHVQRVVVLRVEMSFRCHTMSLDVTRCHLLHATLLPLPRFLLVPRPLPACIHAAGCAVVAIENPEHRICAYFGPFSVPLP
jgi:hypothetical protein